MKEIVAYMSERGVTTVRGKKIDLRLICILVSCCFDKNERTHIMSEDNKQEAKPVPQQTEKQANPFGNLNPAEIPTRLHTFSYQGGEKEKEKGNN